MDLIIYYIHYLQCSIYNKSIKTIQKYYRRHLFIKNLRKYIHYSSFKNTLEDIIHLSYLPPNSNYPLIKNGGINYRINETSFYLNLKILSSINLLEGVSI